MHWLFADQILECVPGKSIVTTKSFPRSDYFFDDHLPGFPIVPGVLQIEMLVAASFLCIRIHNPNTRALLAMVKKAKFYRPVKPGEQCTVQIKSLTLLKTRARANGTIHVGKQKVAEAEIYLSLSEEVQKATRLQDKLIQEWRARAHG